MTTPPTDVNEAIEAYAANCPHALAVFSTDGQEISFRQLARAIRGIARQLEQVGTGPGRQVQFIVDNPVVQLCGWLATMRLGAVPVLAGTPLPAALGLQPDTIVALSDQIPPSADWEAFDQSWLTPPEEAPPLRPHEGCIVGSSGSTGTMKLMHVDGAGWNRQVTTTTNSVGRPDAPFLIGFELASTAGAGPAFRALVNGQAIVLPADSALITLQRAKDVGCGYVAGPPPMLEDFCETIESGAITPFSTVTRAYSIGSSISALLMDRITRCFGVAPLNAYGATEVGVAAVGSPTTDPNPEPGLVGPVCEGVALSFRDEVGQEVPAGTDGRIHIRRDTGPLAGSYFNHPEPLLIDGWFATGDYGRLRSDGQLVLSGRVAELINVGGANRAPAYFEAVILKQPGVSRAAAFALPGPNGYDTLAFAVVPTPGFDEKLVKSAMAAHFVAVKEISLHVMPTLPLGRTGKIDRRALRAQALNAD